MTEAAYDLLAGIDIGSTTTKVAVLRSDTRELVMSDYRRHHADQLGSLADVVGMLKSKFGEDARVKLAMTGSGAKVASERLSVSYIQEVVANSIFLRENHPETRCAIELGGQDAKVLFFRTDPSTGVLTVSDMRMNGVCAGGTGAFLDEVATILKVSPEELDALAAEGENAYDVSGRCGVYAKTDIQPLLNQGARTRDLALSAMHAIAKQTIGGLAQGLTIEAPVAFEGGPLTYNPTLVEVFAERLGLDEDAGEVVRPDEPELAIAKGAALSLEGFFAGEDTEVALRDLAERIASTDAHDLAAGSADGELFFGSNGERDAWRERHGLPEVAAGPVRAGGCGGDEHDEQNEISDTGRGEGTGKGEHRAGKEVREVFLGIDSGSTTTKFVILGRDGELLDSFYASNKGEPLAVAQRALVEMRDRWRAAGIELDVVAAGTTGYGEMLFATALAAETHTVETVAHARATTSFAPDASFILDIGGQDMKAIWLDDGIITNVVVNEACSSGCGSFLENFADTLGIPVERIADEAFSSVSPAVLGSRCTVFMNSSIVTEQRNGKQPADIMAGLARSIIANVFTKVIRLSNLDSLGEKIVVQGGTFQNDAVLRAMEQYTNREVTRAPYPGLMGAIGAAMMAADASREEDFERSFVGFDAIREMTWETETGVTCPFCTNRCKRSVVRFSGGGAYVTNNRCERGLVLGDVRDAEVRERARAAREKAQEVPNLFELREELLFREYPVADSPSPATPPSHVASPQPVSEIAFCSSAAERADEQNAISDTSKGGATGREGDTGEGGDTGKGERRIRIGIPRILNFWEMAPFWTTVWRSLGFDVVLSDASTREMYEEGLHAVTSDTECFPAKLMHGHIRDLVRKGVDRIFCPSITTMPSENTSETSISMCGLVKGYPIVLRNSDNPEDWAGGSGESGSGESGSSESGSGEGGGPVLDTPLWHWFSVRDRDRQLASWFKEKFGIAKAQVRRAVAAGDAAQDSFRRELREAGGRVIEEARREGRYAIVLASRPYHNDALVNHDLPKTLARSGIAVLPPDAVPGIDKVDMSRSRIDVVNNYHARMLATAILAAEDDALEYVQLVSFGCGHDAYLSDEIVRMMREISGKVPLVLKVDESDATGSIGIRVRSFVETISMRRAARKKSDTADTTDIADAVRTTDMNTTDTTDTADTADAVRMKDVPGSELADPYPVKFTDERFDTDVVLVPNTSHAFSELMAAVFSHQGVEAVSLPVGRERAIELGKRYVHNDICFPAQIVIGEELAALESGNFEGRRVSVGMARYVGCCRLTHYGALLRKALDDFGYPDVAILTNDDVDSHDMHPGFRMSLASAINVALGLPMIDALEALLRRMRPYELVEGSANEAFDEAVSVLMDGIRRDGIPGTPKAFEKSIEIMKRVEYDRSDPRPTVLIVGEYLLNFHPGANHDIEDYLERNGFEIVEARMTDVIRKTYFYQNAQDREYHVSREPKQKLWNETCNRAFDIAHSVCDSIGAAHPLYEPPENMRELVKGSDPIFHHTYDSGEGVLIPAEIVHHAERGCKNFVILQPFGCLPNHVVGRGIVKKLKGMYPDVQILPLDYDPDVSFANVENRLQMLVMNQRAGSA